MVFKSATLIGTTGKNKVANLGVFSNLVHLGADPALIGFINRPREAAPHTIANIETSGVYTMNHIHPSFIQQAHQASAKYAAEESEFNATGLGIEWKGNCAAPFVAESKIKYAMELVEIIAIRPNGTFFVIGKVLDVYADEKILASNGYLHLEKLDSVCSLGTDGYYRLVWEICLCQTRQANRENNLTNKRILLPIQNLYPTKFLNIR